MAKLTEYPKAKKFDAGDILIKDGTNGTHAITVEDVTKEFGVMLADNTLSEEGKLAPADAVGKRLTDMENYLNIDSGMSDSVVSFYDGVYDLPLKKLIVDINPVQSGSGNPSPANIRPISGWTNVRVRRTGKNIWSGNAVLEDVKDAIPDATVSATARTVGFKFDSTALYPILGDGSENRVHRVRFKENTRYTFVLTLGKNSALESNLRIGYTDGTSVPFPSLSNTGAKETKVFVTAAEKTVKNLYNSRNDGVTTLYADACGLFEGDLTEGGRLTAAEVYAKHFEAYRGTEVVVEFPAETGDNGTVYGGTLNVLTGELTVTWGMKDLGDVIWYADGAPYVGRFRTPSFSSVMDFSGDYDSGMLCSAYRPWRNTNVPSTANNLQIMKYPAAGGLVYITELEYAGKTAAEFNEHVRGVQFAYKLKTPVTHQLTSEQMATLFGENHIFAETGAIDLIYATNIKRHLDEINAENREYTDGMVSKTYLNIAEAPASIIAERSYRVGEFVVVDSILYKVTSAIAVDESFQPGVNITRTTIGAELTAIYDLINP